MYLPRALLSKLYLHLQATRRPLSPPVLLLVALEPDALCACRILCRLLRHDYIPHKIQPVSGYADLQRVGRTLVAPMMETRGGSGGVVVCLGVGGMVDLAAMLGLESDEESSDAALSYGGVEVWVLDSRRPWNLSNIFGGAPLRPAAEVDAASASSYQARCPDGVVAGRIEHTYRPGGGGIIVFDDGDIEEDLGAEREAYMALLDMPEVDDDGRDLSETEDESEDDEDGDGDEDARDDGVEPRAGQKRKSWSDQYGSDDDDDDDRPRQRRRSNSVSETAPRPRFRRRVARLTVV